MNADDSFWHSEIFGASVFAFVITFNLVSVVVTSRRLNSWAHAEKIRVLRKQHDVEAGAPPWFHRRAIGCYYVTVEDEERHVFRGWIRVGGIWATICNRKPIVVWDGLPDYVKR